MTATPPTLDETVRSALAALRERGAPDPRTLFALGTGAGLLAERLGTADDGAGTVELGPCGLPAPWDRLVLQHGRFGPDPVWLLELPLEQPLQPGAAAWTRGLPFWIAARAGARVAVITAAGRALPASGDATPPIEPGTLALAADHLNLSGASPLVGLGESELGPLFPDLSRLHHAGLRGAALAEAERRGIAAREAVVACTHGPSLETPAEAAYLARAGAQVSVQGLADPLLAAGHAGLAVLAVCAVTDAAAAPADVATLARTSSALAPALEEFLLALGSSLADTAATLAAERGDP